MSNSLTALNKEMWEKELQINLQKRLVALEIADVISGIKDGDTINKPYMNRLSSKTYTKGSDFTVYDATATNEQLTIDKAECSPVYVDQIDNIQNSYSTRQWFTEEAVTALKRRIDGNLLAEYDNANSIVDAGDVGGVDGVAITASVSNIAQAFMAAGKYLDNLNVSEERRFAVVSPTVASILELYVQGKDTMAGDEALMKGAGYIMNRFGFYVRKSTNLTYTAVWTPADQPSDGDTITINGVTLTFETGAIDTAGKVKSETSVAITLDNLVSALNAPGTSSSTYEAVSQDNQRLLEGVVATDGTTYLGLEVIGGGELTVSASETNDPWTVKTVHNLFGQIGATSIGLQATPSVGFNQEPKRLPGSGNLVAWDLYGFKTWLRNKDRLVDVKFVV
jgi:hypothetical protein